MKVFKYLFAVLAGLVLCSQALAGTMVTCPEKVYVKCNKLPDKLGGNCISCTADFDADCDVSSGNPKCNNWDVDFATAMFPNNCPTATTGYNFVKGQPTETRHYCQYGTLDDNFISLYTDTGN